VPRAIILAIDPVREIFAAEANSGECGVFWVISGPTLQAGDILDGDAIGKGYCYFKHPEGTSIATGETGPIGRDEALRMVRVLN